MLKCEMLGLKFERDVDSVNFPRPFISSILYSLCEFFRQQQILTEINTNDF